MTANETFDRLISLVQSKLYLFKIYQAGVVSVFREDPLLKTDPPTIHSIRTRIKDLDHLRSKLVRKVEEGIKLTEANIFDVITDIAGVRVLHLHQQQFALIHESIQGQVKRGDWVLHEKPKAYTWDPESQDFFVSFGLDVQVKESYYTSIHYVVRPRPDSEVSCEIQVRTLFEEIWGEIDHTVNYSYPTTSLACREQIRVLARLVGAGSRLADSIFRSHTEHQEKFAQSENEPNKSSKRTPKGTAELHR